MQSHMRVPAPSATRTPVRTVAAMRSRRHIDTRRLLLPKDYLVDPWQFGRAHRARTHVPPDGDDVSRDIAEIQHELVFAWRAAGKKPPAAQICQRFDISKQTWSRVTLGERWAGETILVALLRAAAVGRRVSTASEKPTGPAGR